MHLGAGEMETLKGVQILKPRFRLLSASRISEATHVIYPAGGSITKVVEDEGKTRRTKTHHVLEQWLEDSVKLKECQEEKLYRVK